MIVGAHCEDEISTEIAGKRRLNIETVGDV